LFRNSNRLLQHKLVKDYIAKNTPINTKPAIMVFKVSLAIEKTCQKYGLTLLNTSSALNKKYELKISQFNNLPKLLCFFPKTIITTLSKTNYNEISKKLGKTFVIQYNRGHTGSSTSFIKDEKDFIKEKQLYPNRLARIAELIKGESYTVNACSTRFGIAYGGLSYQITGIKECTNKEGGTVGNDWSYPKKLKPKVHSQIKEILEKLHSEMFASGIKGLFGIDIIITPRQRVYLIEVNARQPASTSMHTKLMLNEEFIPLQAFHFAEFLFEDNISYIRFLNSYFSQSLSEKIMERYIIEQNKLSMLPIEAAQLFFRNTTDQKKKISRNITQGIYRITSKEKYKYDDGYSIKDIVPGDYLILSTQQGQYVSPDTEVARVQCLSSIVNEKEELLPEIKIVKDLILKNIAYA
jgi:hypothetical protein